MRLDEYDLRWHQHNRTPNTIENSVPTPLPPGDVRRVLRPLRRGAHVDGLAPLLQEEKTGQGHGLQKGQAQDLER